MNETSITGLEAIRTVTEYTILVPLAPLFLDGLRVRVIGDSLDDKPRLCIELTAGTGIRDIVTQWETIKFWRDALSAVVPVPEDLFASLRKLLMTDLDRRKKAGESHQDLANWLNGRIESELVAYLGWLNWLYSDLDSAIRPSYAGNPLDLDHPSHGILRAMALLRWFGEARSHDPGVGPMTDDKRIELLREALLNLDDGRPAWRNKDWAPILADMVKARLREWRKKTS